LVIPENHRTVSSITMAIFESAKKGVVDTIVPTAGSTTPEEVPNEKKRGIPEVEEAREGVEQHPPMTIKRFMAIFSLGCLLAAAQVPLYLLGGSLGK
jgi:hypothetical protein